MQKRHSPVGKAHVAAQVGADSGAGIDDRGLSTHGTAETDGQGARHHRREQVVALDLGLVLGNGLQDFRHAVADVVPDDVPDNQQAQEHSHAGKEEEQPGGFPDQRVQPMVDGVNGDFQQDGRQAAQNARQHGEEGNARPLRKGMQKGPKRAPEIFHAFIVHGKCYSSSEPLPYWAMLSSGKVSPAESEASALPPATASFSASSSPSSQRSTSSRSSVLTLIFTR